MAEDRAFDLSDTPLGPHAFIQWKGTDVCMDFHCECTAHLHFDGYFAHYIECPHCRSVWQMPINLFPRKVTGTKGMTPAVMEADEDMPSIDTRPTQE